MMTKHVVDGKATIVAATDQLVHFARYDAIRERQCC